MKLEYQYTFEDYRDANRAHGTARTAGQRMLILLIVASSIGCALWSMVGPLPAVAVTATTAPANPASPADLLNSIVPYLPWVFVILMVFILARPKVRTSQRVFDKITSGASRWLAAPPLTIVMVMLAVMSTAIQSQRQSNRTTPPTSNSWIEWLPWAVVFVFLWFVFRNIYKKNWKQQPALTRFQTLEYSADSLTCSNDLTTTTYRWAAFLRCVETADLFLLYPSGITFVIVPKRAFPSPEAIGEFRGLVNDWADGRSVGFPVIRRVEKFEERNAAYGNSKNETSKPSNE